MKLLIGESPSKTKTIEKYLKNVSHNSADKYTVRASVGHIRDLPKSNKQAIDIEGGFIPRYEISKGKEKIVHELQGLAEKASEILLATDPDREGEAIAWHIKELLEKDPEQKLSASNGAGKKTEVPIKRVRFYEITEEAVREAIKNPEEIDMKLVKAQEARRVLDRLVGYDLSGLIWKKVRYGLSAGRVQSPALRIIMEREREIRSFKPETFFVISAELETANKENFVAFCDEEPKTKSEADKIYDAAKNGNWSVKEITETEVKRAPKPPFITSTLQQVASTRLGFSPKRTMMTAQKLYEAGHITYMRTDSLNMATVALGQIKGVVENKFGAELHQFRTYKTKSKNAQEAHEAIRPTHFDKENAGTTDDQKKLYRLIWQRAVASQMKDATMMRTKIITEIKDANI